MHGFAEKGMKINAYPFDGVALFNESTLEYYNNNLALLNREVREGLFSRPNLTIYTKVRNAIPSYYGEDSEIDDCIVADGCRLEGRAEHSVLFRGVKLGKGASIKDSIIMADTVIEEGAILENVILDKNVIVHAGAKLYGTPEHPVVIKRGAYV